MKNVLVVAAHPDDEVLGCGGTIARMASSGAEVNVVIFATGLTSRTEFDPAQSESALRAHHDRAKKAGAVLGAKSVRVLAFPDQRMDSIPLLDITQALEREIAESKPDTIFTHHGGDLNMDHVILHRATLVATRPVAAGSVRRVYTYEVPSSTEWAFQKFEPQFRPSVFFDVQVFIEKKIEAMEIYKSEARTFPHPRSPEALRAIAARWGSVVGVPAAEAFELVREIR